MLEGGAAELDDQLLAAAGSLGARLDAVRGSGSELLPPIPALDADAAALARTSAELDRWVGQVGLAFSRAGQGIGLLGGLFALHGMPLRLFTADPSWSADQVAASLAALLGLDEVPTDGDLAASATNPELVRRFVDSLTEDQRDELVDAHPELVGPVDGMPAELRYEANRALIAKAEHTARDAGDSEAADRYRALLADADRQFIFFDPTGDGRVAEVFGDIAAAANVAVVVPGINTTLANFGGLSGDAADLQAEATLRGGGDQTAVVAWLGYDTPGFSGAPFRGEAEAAAPQLHRFLDGLVLDPVVDTTVVAHSYGTLVTSRALAGGLEVDNVTVLGSPGMEVDSVAELDLPEGTDVYASRAPLDYVSWTENFGRDPSDPRFGAERLATGSGSDGLVQGHSDYFMTGSESLRNLGPIIDLWRDEGFDLDLDLVDSGQPEVLGRREGFMVRALAVPGSGIVNLAGSTPCLEPAASDG